VLKKTWNWFWTPSRRYAWGGIFVVGGVAGIIFWGGFNTVMEATNTLPFCISCHEMQDNVAAEYRSTVHFQNRSGVRATCSDCHVPDPWVHKIVRKVKATNELFHWALGTIDTAEKFEDKRLTLAKSVWKSMKQTDSRECRNCHAWDAMVSEKQKRRAWKQHTRARQEGMTCIDCHKGIAHRSVHVLLDEDDDPYDGKPDARRLISKVEEARQKAEQEAKRKAAEEAAKKAAEEAAARKAIEEEAMKAAAAAKAAAEKARAAVAQATEQTTAQATGQTPAQATAPAAAIQTAAASAGGLDWSGVPSTDVVLLYPGQASLEWVLNGKDHGGGRAVRRAGDPCGECHKTEQADMGQRIVTGEKAEPTPIPGKRGSIKLAVQAQHDGTNVTFRFQWPDAPHTPAPFAEGGKMDPKNQVKLAVMMDDGKVEDAQQLGCWVTCHHDSRMMPDHPKADALAGDVAKRIDAAHGVSKYTKGSRTKLEYKGKGGKPRGAWDKLIDQADLDAKMAEGAFMDLFRFTSGDGIEEGYVLANRVLEKTDKISGAGAAADGTWTVTLTRPLKAIRPGGVTLEPGKTYTVGIAIHDDYTAARFHHVSLEYNLALDSKEAEINVVKK